MSITSQPRPARLRLLLLCTALPASAVAQTTTSDANAPSGADDLSPVVVTATRNKSVAGKTPQKVTIITREQIEQQLAITQDPSQVLSNLVPSYSPSRQKLNNTGETFRGRSVLFMIDGVPQSNPLRDGGRDSYAIDLSMVERIEVIHGASAEHGLGATGGIINYVTKGSEGAGVHQHAGISLTSDDDFKSDGLGHKLNYRLSGQQGDWDYQFAASREERGVFYDGNDEIVGMAYHGEIQNSTSYDLMAKAGYWFDDNQNLEFSLNHFDLDIGDDYVPVSGDRDAGIPTTARKGSPDSDPGYNEVTTARLSYSHADWLGNDVDAQLYTQRFRAQFGATGLGSFPYQDDAGNTLYDYTRNESDKVGAKFTLSRDGLLDDRLTLTTGLDLLQDETQQVLVETNRNYVPESQFRNYAAFLQGDYDLTEALSLHAGVRQEHAKLNVDDYSTVDRSTSVENDLVSVNGGSPSFDETLFNAGIVYQATDWAQLYANYSEGFGMPDVGRVLRGVSTPGQDVDTLIDLSPIVTDNREIGARFNWDRYGLELSYYESNSDLGQRIQPDAQGNYRVQREKTEIQGIEITGEARLNDAHDLRLSYTHAEGKSDTDGDGSVDTKLTGRDLAPDTLKLAWSASWNDKLSTHLQYSRYFDRSFDDPAIEFDGYGLLDASLAYRLPVGRASLGIENLTDEDYFTYYSQSFPQSSALEDDLYFKGRGRTLTLSYQLDF
ncbi:TonB-dependent receptor [Halomonas elongata]|uniref:TonB-dependent receptor n=2 Tax=Halomonas elongata TaxID=2746 RepID=E1V640_HALED|nr:TonB-dependent receptor [Halomonas elongata]MDL4862949.1 TonB-dependent receptor [Halomonas elongata]OBX33965.1 ferric aerobactin receptor precursor [Halomonas elongata]RAW07689.1 TonB-dependent receptor [Halomonas elongata]WBF16967.1 TonB-dependent receptor [Halomonas elongata]WPU45798.1 TonB-dependent receptor [Halomonas elongata DSM 2581]